MTNQEILTKAIEKAIDGGWDFLNHQGNGFRVVQSGGVNSIPIMVQSLRDDGEYHDYACAYEIIFNHQFAKALWGNESGHLIRAYTPSGLQVSGKNVPYWKIQLIEMVIADDPIQYLGEHI